MLLAASPDVPVIVAGTVYYSVTLGEQPLSLSLDQGYYSDEHLFEGLPPRSDAGWPDNHLDSHAVPARWCYSWSMQDCGPSDCFYLALGLRASGVRATEYVPLAASEKTRGIPRPVD